MHWHDAIPFDRPNPISEAVLQKLLGQVFKISFWEGYVRGDGNFCVTYRNCSETGNLIRERRSHHPWKSWHCHQAAQLFRLPWCDHEGTFQSLRHRRHHLLQGRGDMDQCLSTWCDATGWCGSVSFNVMRRAATNISNALKMDGEHY